MKDGDIRLIIFLFAFVCAATAAYCVARTNRNSIDRRTAQGCLYISSGASDKRITADAVPLRRSGDTNWYCPNKIEE